VKIRLKPSTVRAVGQPLVSALAATWRFDVDQSEMAAAVRAGERTCVIVCWHEEILPLLWYHRGIGIGIVVSEARDGQYLADMAEKLGYELIRGSSTRGGVRALLGAVSALEDGVSVTFTPDGPQGPRRYFAPGAALAAHRAGVPILPIRATASSAWRLRSWDRFVVPKPGARIRIHYGNPILPGSMESPDPNVEQLAAAAERALNLLGSAA
jgi:lysophospholipid acyltransferase (LPLAT)-like uncharacterized protein